MHLYALQKYASEYRNFIEFMACHLHLPDFTEISINCRVTNGSFTFLLFPFISTVCVV